jgi:hypothetical protein
MTFQVSDIKFAVLTVRRELCFVSCIKITVLFTYLPILVLGLGSAFLNPKGPTNIEVLRNIGLA